MFDITHVTERPTRGGEPNPFAPHFPVPDGEALIVTLANTAGVSREVNKARRLAREAAHALGMSARVSQREDEETVTLTVWTTERIFKPGSGRKPNAAAAKTRK